MCVSCQAKVFKSEAQYGQKHAGGSNRYPVAIALPRNFPWKFNLGFLKTKTRTRIGEIGVPDFVSESYESHDINVLAVSSF